jgi:hypothetical protein
MLPIEDEFVFAEGELHRLSQRMRFCTRVVLTLLPSDEILLITGAVNGLARAEFPLLYSLSNGNKYHRFWL